MKCRPVVRPLWWCMTVWVMWVAGCSRPPPDAGRADLEALGAGLGRALASLVTEGGRAVVVTTPGALGSVAEMEAGCVASLRRALAPASISVVATTYSEDEVAAFQRVQPHDMDVEVFRGALNRAADGGYDVLVSLVGWPEPAHWLGSVPVVAVVSWQDGARMRAVPGAGRLVHVVRLGEALTGEGDPDGSGSGGERALARFDAWFSVEVTP